MSTPGLFSLCDADNLGVHRLDTQRADLMAKKGKLESGGRLSPEGKGSKKKGFLGNR